MTTLARFHERTVREIHKCDPKLTDLEVQSRARLVGAVVELPMVRIYRVREKRESKAESWRAMAREAAEFERRNGRRGAIREVHGLRVEAAASAD